MSGEGMLRQLAYANSQAENYRQENCRLKSKLEAIDELVARAPDDVLRTEIHRVIQAGDFAQCLDCRSPLWDNERFCPWCKSKQDAPDNPADYADGPGISSNLRRP